MNSLPLTINCDLGEWDNSTVPNRDNQLMHYIQMANIACGGHAGSAEIIRQTLSMSIEYGIDAGAHPGYEDRANFGRKSLDISDLVLKDSIARQLDIFCENADLLRKDVYHVKPHGALYHDCNHNEKVADVFLDLIIDKYSIKNILGLPGSILEKTVRQTDLTYLAESFIDRGYDDEGNLLHRGLEGAMINSPILAKNQYENLKKGKLISINGKELTMISATSCVHSDNPSVVEILSSITGYGQA